MKLLITQWVKSISPEEGELKRSTSSCWAALQIDFWMLCGLIFHLRRYNVVLVMWKNPGECERRRIFLRFSLQKVLSAPCSFSTLASSLIHLASSRLRSQIAFSSLAQENTSWQREKRLHKGGATHSGTNRGPGDALLWADKTEICRGWYIPSRYKNIWMYLRVMAYIWIKHTHRVIYVRMLEI